MSDRDDFLKELDLVAPNMNASHNNTVFTRDEIMRAFDRYLSKKTAPNLGHSIKVR